MKLKKKWQKALCVALSSFLLVTGIPVEMLADEVETETAQEVTIVAEGSCGENATYTLDSNGLVTVSGTGEMKALNLYSYGVENVKSVVIESGITALGRLALSEYLYLENIQLADTITSIGWYALQYAAIKEIVLPDSVITIDEAAFTWCKSLEKIVLSKNLETIGEAAFWGCTSLTSLEIPASVTSIGDAAFDYCESLTDIYYEGTQEQWNAICKAEIPETITIHYEEDENVSDETESNVIANDETGIPDAGFYAVVLNIADTDKNGILTKEEAAAITRLELPYWNSPNVKNLNGIEYFINLETLVLRGNELTDISAIAKLPNLKNLTSNLKQIDLTALAGAAGLTTLNLSESQISDITALSALTNLTTLNLSRNKITDISALAGLTNLTTLDLVYNSITDISALSGLTNLKELNVSDNQIVDVSPLKNLINLETLSIGWNKITDISPLADLALNYKLKNLENYGNNITTIGNFPEHVVYGNEVEIRYLADADKARFIEILGLSEYDGKVICINGDVTYSKMNPYGNSGYGYAYEINRDANGKLYLGAWIDNYSDNDGNYAFAAGYPTLDAKNPVVYISRENGNVWIVYEGDPAASGLNFTDKVEKATVIEPFAKAMSGANITKAFKKEYGLMLNGTLSDADVKTVMEYFGFDSYGGGFGIISADGAEYKLDFAASTYEKEDIYEIGITYYDLYRDEETGELDIEWDNNEWFQFNTGKMSNSSYHEWDEPGVFLTKGDIGTDIEDCVFRLPAKGADDSAPKLMFVNIYTLNGRSTGNLMVYNDAKTMDVCQFVSVEEPEEETEDTTDNDTEVKESYTVELTEDKTSINTEDFAALLQENATKDVVIKSNNGVTFTFAAGTMAAVEGMENYDFGTSLVSDYANAGDMGDAVTASNFITRINFNYSGKLPATASIKIYVGTEYAGKTLHYSKLVEAGYMHLMSVTVDAEGYVVVKQDSCSDYVLTTEKIGVENTQEPQNPPTDNDGTNKPGSPAGGDISTTGLWMLMVISALGCMVFGFKRKQEIVK